MLLSRLPCELYRPALWCPRGQFCARDRSCPAPLSARPRQASNTVRAGWFPLLSDMMKTSRMPQAMEQIDVVELYLLDPDLVHPTHCDVLKEPDGHKLAIANPR